MIEPSVSLTPNSLTPSPLEKLRDGHVRELWPLLLQCEHRRVIFICHHLRVDHRKENRKEYRVIVPVVCRERKKKRVGETKDGGERDICEEWG